MATDEATAQIKGWFTGRLPEGWFTGAPEIVRDREEIAVLGTLPEPDFEGSDVKGPDVKGSDAERAALIEGLIGRFREETRERRIEIAKEAERRFGQKISWGIVCGDATVMFTTLSVPVMTRLRQQERQVLDTLVAAGVARSRSDALAWCVRLVGKNTDTWLSELRDALQHVDRVRSAGPDVNS
jgi:hypothetical protein